MKIIKTLSIALFLSLLITACSNDNADVANTEDEQQKQDQQVADEEEQQWQSKPGDVMDTEGGKFTLVARNYKVGNVEVGPLSFHIPQVATLSGELYDDFKEFVGEDYIEYVQIDMEVVNSSEQDVVIQAGDIKITTSNGEEVSPSEKLSVIIDSEFEKSETKQGSLFFLLETGNVEELEWVEVKIPAPTDGSGNEIGEEKSFKVEL
ncbi:hypothetical protein [Sutcliffiella cohnii]|uniref:DUF4352 domain-containing protein n=1 Tax=Sutcliffiella cohnii TaxID=33932 RepID=A0A223KRL8_9BACI|nr:hypothetical protein [Sutcliffiella cohnii]AST91973.1 hypothetical protein BC6307_12160 [Sutcliffiella cohnii]MED4015253.1 hypothetical protein [Sutcliffiella cohnii]